MCTACLPTTFSQNSERKGSRSGSLMRSTVRRDRDRWRMRPWIDRVRPVGSGITISEETSRGFFFLLHRTSSSRVLPPFPFPEILHVPLAREYAYNACPYLNASHDIPLVRVSNGTPHNSPRERWRMVIPVSRSCCDRACDLGKDRDSADRP